MQVVVDDLLVNCRRKGSGPTMLLLHGWGDRLETFTKLQDDLASNFDVITLDLPGFGSSQMPKTAWELKDYVSFLKHFLQKLNVVGLAAVAGHSNGGALAIKVVAGAQIESKRLILLSASGIRDRHKIKKSVLKALAKIGNYTLFWLPYEYKLRLRTKLYGVAGSDMMVAPHLQETFKKTVTEDVQNEARLIRIPTMIVYGQNDTATPPSFGQIYSKLIKNSRLFVLPGAGHFIHHDQPEYVRKYIEEFLGV
jgi:pimeloyl-ACP methyl ester carboxylesterase